VLLQVLPTPGRSALEVIPSAANCSASPIPESINIRGVSKAPAGKITSRDASTRYSCPSFDKLNQYGAKTSVELALIGNDGLNGRFIHLGEEVAW